VVVVGESLVDIVVTAEGRRTEHVGGSPMNVAVGLGRLDVPALLVTQVGEDPRGRRIVEHVRDSGARICAEPAGTTSTATATLDEHNQASYDFELTWSLHRQLLPETTALHFGSLGAALEPGRQAVLDLARQAAQAGLFVSFDPNIRPVFVTDRAQAWRDVVESAELATLVKVSDDDLAVLRPGASMADLAAEVLAGERTELVIVTCGAAGAHAFGGGDGGRVSLAPPDVRVVDAVGAGDSFMAATLACLADRGMLAPGALADSIDIADTGYTRTLLDAAMTAAAVTVSRRGANPPTRRELPPAWPLC
jgi:fructokinase